MLPNNNITLLAGTLAQKARGTLPFEEDSCAYLADLSSALLRDKEAKALPDVMAFAFWCRKAPIAQLKSRFEETNSLDAARLGRGLIFHICPSNVPINAFYSFAFGLLAGNGNIIRLPSLKTASVDLLLKAINQLFMLPKYKTLKASNGFVRYETHSDATTRLSALCDGRIIWGGDATIANVRLSPIPPRAVEITFADRYSFAVIDTEYIEKLSDDALGREATNFFNDTLQMDQNACSSPHLIIWLNGHNTAAKTRFWQALENYTQQKYSLEPVQSVDRYTRLLSGFVIGPGQRLLTDKAAAIQRVELQDLPADIDQIRGTYGLFYEYDVAALQEVAHIVNMKYQTLAYLGPDKAVLRDFVLNNHLQGIDRIVPFGEALNIDVIWDGQDVLKILTRIIDVR
jgi:Acyl-CoA reductase (LuxC)